MAKRLWFFLATSSLSTAGNLRAAAGETSGVAQVQDYSGLILMVAGFALAVVVVVALCRRCRRRSKLNGLSHLL
jgi:hypothetical protein